MEEDVFYTIEEPIRTELPKIKGSRFLAEAYPVKNVAEITEILSYIKKQHGNATHHCYAYRFQDLNHFRANDDGEPNGTAGMPILRQIDKLGLCDILVVVIRYFGGTKLGTGGLIRAYGDAAAEVLAMAQVCTMVKTLSSVFLFDYSDTALAMHALKGFEAEIEELSYDQKTTMKVKIRASQQKAIEARFLTLLQGRGIVNEIA